MHFKWNYSQPTPAAQQTAKELSEKIGMSPILTRLLVARGITTESAAKRFFRPQLADLINPFLMKDMDVAVDKLNNTIKRRSSKTKLPMTFQSFVFMLPLICFSLLSFF